MWRDGGDSRLVDTADNALSSWFISAHSSLNMSMCWWRCGGGGSVPEISLTHMKNWMSSLSRKGAEGRSALCIFASQSTSGQIFGHDSTRGDTDKWLDDRMECDFKIIRGKIFACQLQIYPLLTTCTWMMMMMLMIPKPGVVQEYLLDVDKDNVVLSARVICNLYYRAIWQSAMRAKVAISSTRGHEDMSHREKAEQTPHSAPWPQHRYQDTSSVRP